jgi:hypothetical protein
MTNTQGQLRIGFGIGSAAGAVLASVLLVLLFPTYEYRARLWFLLATTGPDFSLEAGLGGAFWLAGTLALLAAHRLALRSVLGTALAAAAYVAALKAGAWKLLPEFTSFGLRLAITVFTAALAVWLVSRAGRVRGPAPEGRGA